MFLHAEPTWEKDVHRGVDGTGDARSTPTHWSRRRASCTTTEPIDGVLCWDEARILQTASRRRGLGLPGGDVAMVNRCRDKHLTRTALAEPGVPQPESVLVDTVDEALADGREARLPGDPQAARRWPRASAW